MSFSRLWRRLAARKGVPQVPRIWGHGIARPLTIVALALAPFCSFGVAPRTCRAPSFERLLLEGWDTVKRRSKFLASSTVLALPGIARSLTIVALALAPLALSAQQHFDGNRAYDYAREFAAIGPRWPTSPGHVKAQEFLRAHFLQNHDQFEQDNFTADTPIGPVQFCNYIVRFPGRKSGIIVLGTHYETNYWLRNINFVGANDGASTTGLLLAIADRLRAQSAQSRDKKLDGYSVWLVFFDGEEAIQSWSRSDSTYGSRHLAAKWGQDGTLNRIKAFLLADMIGDKDLDIERETNSTPWLISLVEQAAKTLGDQRYFFQQSMAVEDDHLPFVERGVPSIDVIDLDYGPNNSYHHTAQDTMDKISAHSLTIDGDVFMETTRLIDQR